MKMFRWLPAFLVALPLVGRTADTTSVRPPLPFKAPARLPDVLESASLDGVRLEGFLGRRVAVNAETRLLHVDPAPLLAGFKRKPGSHPWIGEHIGKWMHATTLAWANTGNPALRAKLDAVAAELIAAQEPDGYLGTYVPEKRFGLFPEADWDVWSHKYNLMGLLTYYQYTGNEAALAACRRMGDLLIATFGPGRKSILSAGTHVGMAATSVLEPMVLLYRHTDDARYLDFARYLVRAWDEPNGPAIIAALLTRKQVNRTANGKAYEMLSNLVGLCELARATGDRALLDPVLNAWEDIVSRRLYLTGSASQGEHFHDDYSLPNQTGAHVAETCVTTTWIQLNLQLLRLTGDARFGGELERTFYNHLAAAQRPDGAEWCYFTALEGVKPYGPGVNCCVSSGPRGMALVPTAAYLHYRTGGADGVAVNLFEPGQATLTLGGEPVTVTLQSPFPRQGGATFAFHLAHPATFGFRLRAAGWAGSIRLKINGRSVHADDATGWLELPPQRWKDGDRITADYELSARAVVGDHGNAGRAAWMWGPFVLAFEQRANPGLPPAASLAWANLQNRRAVRVERGEPLVFTAGVEAGQPPKRAKARLVPFADAGGTGGPYRVWLRVPGASVAVGASLLAPGAESRSRDGNQTGSINDGDPGSIAVTFNGRPATEDWFGVTLDAPVTVRRVVFVQGQTFHDGGWFDTRSGLPRVQVRRKPGGDWETVGTLNRYPATTGTDPAGLKGGERFELVLAAPMSVTAIRVVGQPSSGDNPAQAFSSCGELEAFAD